MERKESSVYDFSKTAEEQAAYYASMFEYYKSECDKLNSRVTNLTKVRAWFNYRNATDTGRNARNLRCS